MREEKHFLLIYSNSAENKMSFEIHVTTIATGLLSFEARKLEFFLLILEFFFPGPFSLFKTPEVLKI